MPHLNKRSIFSLLFLLAINSFPALHALEADRLQQIDIEADQATFNEAEGLTIYSGNVILSQGSLELKAHSMKIRQTPSQQLKDIKAESASRKQPVTMKQQMAARDGSIEWVNASSQTLIYNMKLNRLEFIGDANIKKGDANIQSEHITYDATKGIFHASNNTPNNKGVKKPSSRVRISLPAQAKKTDEPKKDNKNNSTDNKTSQP